ncbi:AsnC family transcriptional regulator [Methylobacterium sp. DB1607]|nr:AsnC family transcriptional regulator [Methylobacterium sp. DB1607]
MTFEFRCHEGAISPVTNAATFRVDSVVDTQARNAQADLSHLIDPSYEYHSPRELRWHLADRLGITPGAVRLKEAA